MVAENHVGTVHECDRQTDRPRERVRDTFIMTKTALCIASRGKKRLFGSTMRSMRYTVTAKAYVDCANTVRPMIMIFVSWQPHDSSFRAPNFISTLQRLNFKFKVKYKCGRQKCGCDT